MILTVLVANSILSYYVSSIYMFVDTLVFCVVFHVVFFFFFQAEDGIRDLTVTGVQTCALPISLGATPQSILKMVLAKVGQWTIVGSALGLFGSWACARLLQSLLFEVRPRDPEIGRASCRERV